MLSASLWALCVESAVLDRLGKGYCQFIAESAGSRWGRGAILEMIPGLQAIHFFSVLSASLWALCVESAVLNRLGKGNCQFIAGGGSAPLGAKTTKEIIPGIQAIHFFSVLSASLCALCVESAVLDRLGERATANSSQRR